MNDSNLRIDCVLTKLSARAPLWRSNFRAHGFTAGYVDEDWATRELTLQQLHQHEDYLRAYCEAVLLCPSPEEIVYSDKMTGIPQIDKLKQERFEKFGAVEILFANPETRHLVQLSPLERLISRWNERSTPASLRSWNIRAAEKKRRVQTEIEAYRKDVENVLMGDQECLRSAELAGQYFFRSMGGRLEKVVVHGVDRWVVRRHLLEGFDAAVVLDSIGNLGSSASGRLVCWLAIVPQAHPSPEDRQFWRFVEFGYCVPVSVYETYSEPLQFGIAVVSHAKLISIVLSSLDEAAREFESEFVTE